MYSYSNIIKAYVCLSITLYSYFDWLANRQSQCKQVFQQELAAVEHRHDGRNTEDGGRWGQRTEWSGLSLLFAAHDNGAEAGVRPPELASCFPPDPG